MTVQETLQKIQTGVVTTLLSLPGAAPGKMPVVTEDGQSIVFVDPPSGGSNAAPTAISVLITGTAQVGQTLTGNYTYYDADSDAQGVSLKKWYRADDNSGTNRTLISGASGSSTYVLQAEDEGKFIQFEVTPIAATGTTTGTPTSSPYTAAITAAATFQLTDIDALEVWIDATDLDSMSNVLYEGVDYTQTINDKSGKGKHLAAPSGKSPVYKSSGGQNNLPYLELNANAQLFNNSFVFAQPYTAYIVLKSKSWNHLIKPLSFGPTGFIQWYRDALYPNQPGGNSMGLHGTQYKSTNSMPLGSTLNEWGMIQGFFNDGACYIGDGYINDSLQGNIGTNGTTGITLNDGAIFDFHEMFFFSRNLTVQEAQNVHNYLFTKYGFAAKSTANFIGDSITVGYDAVVNDYNATFVSLTANEMGYERVARHATSGSNLVGTMNYSLPQIFRSNVNAKLIVMLGQNDSDGALPGWKTNYEGYVQQMLDAGFAPSNIILCATPPTGSGGANSGLRTALQEICTAFGVVFCDQWTYLNSRLAESYVGVEVHPNATGHRHLADNLKLSLA